ncbi:ankyrin repeat-containing domain protein, partial [Amanita rubescens]
KQWLMPPDPSTNFNNALKTHLDNTGSWLLNSPDYLAWKKRDNSFLWIHGICKWTSSFRILNKHFCSWVRKNCSLPTSFVMFLTMNKRTARGLLCSLVLTLFSPQNQSVLKQVFEKCKDGLQKPTDHDLYEVLKSYLSGFQDVYLFIDALDECANVEEVLELVKLINGWSIRSCHLLVTSRKELPIVNSLRQAMPTEVDLTFMQVNQDIEQYIEHMLSTATELKTWKENAKELIKVTLMEKGKGMFRWVACQLEELKHCSKSPRMLRQKLNGLPTTLESTYDQILTRIEEADAMNAMKLLLWLTFSERPIHVEDLALILEFDVESQQFDVDAKLDYPDDVLKICSSLVTKMKDETVQFAHASIKEYFQSNKRKIGSSVKVDPCFGHYFIGQCGLAYILQGSSWDSIMCEMIYPNYLQIAALHGLIETAKWLMLQPTANNRKDIVEILMESGVDMKAKADALVSASQRGNVHIVKLLLDSEPSASLRGLMHDEESYMMHRKGSLAKALNWAAANNYKDIVEILMESGVDMKAKADGLVSASQRGNVHIVKLLLDSEPSASLRGLMHDEESYMMHRKGSLAKALNWAAVNNYKDIVEILMESGVDMKDKADALVSASQRGNVHIVKLLLDSEPSASLRGLMHDEESYMIHRKGSLAKALNWAAANNYKDIVEILMESGVDMKAKADGLVSASQRGNVHIVKLLLGSEPSASLRGLMHDEESYMMHRKGSLAKALNWAAVNNYKDIVEILMESGVDMKAKADALVSASQRGNVHIVKLLLDSEPSASLRGLMHDEESYMIHRKGSLAKALNWAAANNYKDIVEILMESGVDMKAKADALVSASQRGNVHIVKLLLDSEPSASLRGLMDGEESYMMNWKGSLAEALNSAASNGHKAIVEMLLESGADMKAKTDVAVFASKYPQVHIVQLLLNRSIVELLLDEGVPGADVYDKALIPALSRGHKDIVKLLLEKGACINMYGMKGIPLHVASASNYASADIVRLLLEWGADVDIEAGGDTALQAASYSGKTDIVQLLLEWGANANIQGDCYGSALMAASDKGHKRIVELLLQWGADVNLHGHYFNDDDEESHGSALTIASKWGHKAIAKILLLNGADVNFCDEIDGHTALIHAAFNNNKDIVEMLLQHGADVNIQGKKYGSALYVAANPDPDSIDDELGKPEDLEIVQLLLAHGAK